MSELKRRKCKKCKKLIPLMTSDGMSLDRNDMHVFEIVGYILCNPCGIKLDSLIETWLKEPAK